MARRRRGGGGRSREEGEREGIDVDDDDEDDIRVQSPLLKSREGLNGGGGVGGEEEKAFCSRRTLERHAAHKIRVAAKRSRRRGSGTIRRLSLPAE